MIPLGGQFRHHRIIPRLLTTVGCIFYVFFSTPCLPSTALQFVWGFVARFPRPDNLNLGPLQLWPPPALFPAAMFVSEDPFPQPLIQRLTPYAVLTVASLSMPHLDDPFFWPALALTPPLHSLLSVFVHPLLRIVPNLFG